MPNTNNPHRIQGWRVLILLFPILIASAVVGVVLFVAILALVMVGLLIQILRTWRRRRPSHQNATNQVLEGEFVVIPETRTKNDQMPQ